MNPHDAISEHLAEYDAIRAELAEVKQQLALALALALAEFPTAKAESAYYRTHNRTGW